MKFKMYKTGWIQIHIQYLEIIILLLQKKIKKSDRIINSWLILLYNMKLKNKYFR